MPPHKSLATMSVALTKLAKLIAKHHGIINVCMVDFLTKDIFNNTLECDLKISLNQLTEAEICSLPERFFGVENKSFDHQQALDMLVNELRQHTLESLGVVLSTDSLYSFIETCEVKTGTNLKHFDKFMSDKKMHEVVAMSDVVDRLCTAHSVDRIVDLGSGKAYLSQALTATNKNLHVLAIDSCDINSRSAKNRSERLNKKWDGLKKRAEVRASGLEPPVRSKHARSKRKNEQNLKNESVEKNLFQNKLKFVTQFVSTNTDLNALFTEHFEAAKYEQDHYNFNNSPLGLIGLHTCGNLAANSINIWKSNKSIQFLCNVGCCYHHIDEEFYRNPYLTNDASCANVTPTFPLSSQLKELHYELGRNARMIAAQPMDRLIANRQLPNKALLWRAILQHILLIHVPDLHFENQQVF